MQQGGERKAVLTRGAVFLLGSAHGMPASLGEGGRSSARLIVCGFEECDVPLSLLEICWQAAPSRANHGPGRPAPQWCI